MLSSLRRGASQIEDYECPSCSRPLLTKSSPCPVCIQRKPEAPAAHLNPSALQESLSPVHERAPRPRTQVSASAQTAVLPKLMNIVALVGMLLSVFLLFGPDLRFSLFQGFITLAFSLLLKNQATHA